MKQRKLVSTDLNIYSFLTVRRWQLLFWRCWRSETKANHALQLLYSFPAAKLDAFFSPILGTFMDWPACFVALT